jgi:predicted glycosyltransferase involved in capsule biosynthesis
LTALGLEYQREWERNNRTKRNGYNASYRDRMREFAASLRRPCEKCGNADLRVIHFHHTEPSQKEYNISEMVRNGFGKEKILAEVSKCQCLCANCHIITHLEDRQIGNAGGC